VLGILLYMYVVNFIAHAMTHCYAPQAFSNMTSNIRQALFKIVMLQTFDNDNSIVIDNGEEVSVWYCGLVLWLLPG